MNKWGAILKRVARLAMWVIIGSLLLFGLLALLILIPAVQNKVVDQAAMFISKKTQSRLEIDNIRISFPKTVVLNGIFALDAQSDTLIYARKATVNLALFGFLSNRINIESLDLEDATIKLYTTRTDPMFNYEFLLESFSKPKDLPADLASPSKWTFSLNRVTLKNTQFTYNDANGGMKVYAVIAEADAMVREFDFSKSLYLFNDLLLSGLTLSVLASEPAISQTNDTGKVLPRIEAKKVQLSNSSVGYADSVINLSVFSEIEQLVLSDISVDLQTEWLIFDKIDLQESRIDYHSFEPEYLSQANDSNIGDSGGNNWKIRIKELRVEDHLFSYKDGLVSEKPNEFNPQHLELNHMSFDANDFYYQEDSLELTVSEFNAVDQNGFVINNLETDFMMDATMIQAGNLKLTTPYSTIDADFMVEFVSLDSFTQDYLFSNLNMVMRSVNFRNQDVLYFNNGLIDLHFFTNTTNSSFISGSISGPLNYLTGKNLVVRTGEKTLLETDFTLIGLPDYHTASYHFPNLEFISGKEDMGMLAGPLIPENVALPGDFGLKASFIGKIREFESSAGITSSYGDMNLVAWIDKEENFSGNLSINHFDVGQLLKDSLLYGPVSLQFEATGQGLDSETVIADIKGEATELYLNRYTYQNLTLDGTLFGKEFSGKINLDDKNAVFNFDGLIGLNPGQEFYQFNLDIEGADLRALNLTKEDIRIGMDVSANFEGRKVDKLFGKFGIANLSVAQDERIYILDSLIFTSVNEPNKSEFVLTSPLADAKYAGTISPLAISKEIKRFVNGYFPVGNTMQADYHEKPAEFGFEIQLHNHPVISQILLPQLKVFEPGIIRGSYSSVNNLLKMDATMNRIVYGATEIVDLKMDVNSDVSKLDYSVSGSSVSNSLIKLENFLVEGKLTDNTLFADLSSIDDDQAKNFVIHSQITKEDGIYKLVFDPDEFYMLYNRWDMDPANFIEFSDQGFLIHNLFLKNMDSQINVSSLNQKFNDDLTFELRNFKLDDISRMIERDTSFIKGTADGNLLMKRENNSYGFIADAKITNLQFREIPIGDVSIKATNPEANWYDLDLSLSGPENNLSAQGFYLAREGDNTINVKTTVQSLSMKTIEAFSMGQISESAGTLSGDLFIQGTFGSPDITGSLVFKDVFVKPAILNNRFHLTNETIQFKPGGIHFSSFTLTDINQNQAVIDGTVLMKDFGHFIFDLQVNATDFLLLNTTAAQNENYFGRMIIDSRINVKGPMALPVVDARIRIKRGSNFTFVVPEDRLTTDRGEEIVEFNRPENLSPILYHEEKPETQTIGFTGFDLSSVIEIDKQATLRLLMDPSSTDSLVVRGEAALGFSVDRSGKMSLTGAYDLDEGSYLVSLETLVKRQFDILPGSTIIWNGDPLDAILSINARYAVRAAPYDLLAFQMSGLSAVESGSYKQQYPFWVLLKVRGEILQPVISFEIQLPPDEKGILGGAVNQKLNILNEDESALNKQVFALLVLGRFIQENPFESATGGTTTLVRSTVGKFLSSQLNQLTSAVLPGVGLNFDIQSYQDYQSGEAQGRTQVEIGLKKQLFDERLSVQLGGSIDVEGERARQNQATDIASDILIEYRLTKDGRYRLKGFRHNQYEGAIEGQLVETGVGFVYVRDFTYWKNFFRRTRTENDSPKIEVLP